MSADTVETPEENPEETPQRSRYLRLEDKLLKILPAFLLPFLTPLRLRVFFGYLLVLLLTIYGWEQLATAWRYLVTLLAPATSIIGALFTLKLSVVFVSVFTLLVSLSKVLFGFLVVVLKPGILKAIFATWVHDKSERLQDAVKRVYELGKDRVERMLDWWREQTLLDKVLLSGFLVPFLVVVFLAFVIKRAIAIFAVKKITEQLVQRTTKLVIRNFHKIPLLGGLPLMLGNTARKFTRKSDREDVVDDLKTLGREWPDLDED